MKRNASAVWQGNFQQGKGQISVQSGVLKDQAYSFKARFQDETGRSGTNPEELLAAAHAGCFAMQLSHYLAQNDTPPTRLEAAAVVELIPGKGISSSAIAVRALVPGITKSKFQELAEKAKKDCPVSKALASIEITLAIDLE